MDLFTSFEENSQATEETEKQKNIEIDEEYKALLGAGVALNTSVQTSTTEAKIKYTKPAYNPQTRSACYDNDDAHHKAIQEAFKSGDPVYDPYTGAELFAKQKDAKLKYGTAWQNHAAEADHIDPLSQFVDRNIDNPFLTTKDLKEIGNREDNYQVLSRKLNQTSKDVGKGGSTQEEWANDDRRMQGVADNIETGESKETVTEKIRNTGKKAEHRNDARAQKRAKSNTISTAREAGADGAQNAAVTALTMSGIMNMVAVIKGEKNSDQAIADTVKDTGKAAVSGYVMGGGLTVLYQSFTNTSSEFIQGLIQSNVPGNIITAVVVTGDSLKKWGTGKITTEECIIEIGDKGLNMVTMGYGMLVGQTLIPVPIVGGAVGALVGSALTSSYYRELIYDLKTKQLERQERLRIMDECEKARIQIREFRKQLEEYLQSYFKEYRQCFDQALSSMKYAFDTDDAEGVIAGANEISRKLGRTPQYDSIEEYKCFLDSGTTFKL